MPITVFNGKFPTNLVGLSAAMDTAHTEPDYYPPGTEQGDDTMEAVVGAVVFLH